MKKVDLHIHTIPTISDSDFSFCIEKLKEYIQQLNIDCIAITNHNHFDLNQFNFIKETLEIPIFPGIEISLESGHLLLISDCNELNDFEIRCKQIEALINRKEDYITVDKLKEIFNNLNKYILIPHYEKRPKIKEEIVSELKDYIKAGEVQSPKKFIYCIKNRDSLVPVIFSDLRFDIHMESFTTRQTYFDLAEISFTGLKSCLCDKNKVSLSKKDGNKFFQALENGLELSTGLNVILGERSSGKTYTLNSIYKSNINVKYIRQFELLETDAEQSERKFNKQLSTKNSNISDSFLEEFGICQVSCRIKHFL